MEGQDVLEETLKKRVARELLPGIVCTIAGAPGETVMSALVEKLERNDEIEQSGDQFYSWTEVNKKTNPSLRINRV